MWNYFFKKSPSFSPGFGSYKLESSALPPRSRIPHSLVPRIWTELVDTQFGTYIGKHADEQLKDAIPDSSVRQFLLSNLYRTPEKQFKWRCNLKVISQKLKRIGADINEFFYDPIQFQEAPTLFIQGEKSDYLNSEQQRLIEECFPAAHVVTIEGAGHWVHAEKSADFLEVVLDFLNP